MYLLFVYGSLKQGFGNHYKINQTPLFYASLVGFVLLTKGIGFPAIAPGLGVVDGEVYQVDTKKLDSIDKLEGHPYFYKRELVSVVDKLTLKEYKVFVYVIVDKNSWRLYGKNNWQG